MIEINWHPSKKTLNEFAQVWLFMFGMVLAPLAYFQAGPFQWLPSDYPQVAVAGTLWCLAIVGRLIGLVRPAWLAPVFVGMSLLAAPIGMTISLVLLLAIYLLLFAPLALFFTIVGRDPLTRRLEPEKTTYWEEYNPDRGRARYLRQF